MAQPISEHILKNKWSAYWIEVPSPTDQDEFTVVNFRKKFILDDKPQAFVVHVSADTRYKLYVNGSFASLGPAKSDLHYWNFETLDLAPYLKAGENVIAAVVWNFGKQRPINQFSHRTAFVLQGDTPREELINSNLSWKSMQNKAYRSIPPDLPNVYYASGPGESLNYNFYTFQWTAPDFDDNNWLPAKEIGSGIPKGVFDYSIDWMLVPRDIPALEMKPQQFAAVRETSLDSFDGNVLTGRKSVSIPANAKHIIILDQGHLTNAYPILRFEKGKGSTIRLTYAEALYIDEGNSKPVKDQRQKGNRNEIKGKRFVGLSDEIITDGGKHEFIPLNWHTFRYLKLEIETKEEELMIERAASIFTAYPFTLQSKFNAEDKQLGKILEAGWRTARLCAEELYMDTPYY